MAKQDHNAESPGKSLSYEASIDQLEDLIEQIESGEVGLEDALKHYEDGTKLIQRCRTILDGAEKRIAELSAGADGDLTADVESDDE